MSRLLKDVIDIPTRTGAEDYVLRLTEGVSEDRLAQTVNDYVVTDDLTDAFDRALALVADSLRTRNSRAAFLAGSFGSGKSHFMAVLHALLGEHPAARAKTELQGVVAEHDSTLQGKKFLRLAFHFLDAKSIEQCILGGYVTQIRTLHPDAPLPAVHQSDALLADADRWRERMGDAKFFEGLEIDNANPSPWSSVLGTSGWGPARYDNARHAAQADPERHALVDALVRSYFAAFADTDDYVDLDTGLARISDHAKQLGYDTVVMFLDELVLWLSFHVRDAAFFGRETQKITKLVEGQHERSIPLVSFVARQFDLRRYFDDAADSVGADQQSLDKAFRHQEGRFSTIELGDTNLPYVAQQRLLRPVDDAAAQVLKDAFHKLDGSPEVWDVLLDGAVEGHRGADRAAFQRTYPFSPALVATLRTLSSAMQRDRTALKVMQQLLVDHRDHLTVDDVIPVGDTFDLVINGSHAITPEMHARFRNAQQLYDQKVQPMLLREHQLSSAEIKGLDRSHAFHADDRLMKTLLLSAIAPEVPALKELTAARLAALNHGSIVSPLPGREASMVLDKLRRWSAEIPEIHLTGDPKNPTIRARVSEVDYESVVAKARGEDSAARRQELVKRLVFEQLGLELKVEELSQVTRHPHVWRGSRREVEVVFGNVRDTNWLPDSLFDATQGTWRFVIDFPFDDEGRSVRDDDQRVESLAQRGPTTTVVWLPHHLAPAVRSDLGRLVILDWLMSGPGERWEHASSHLSTADRPQAKSILENARTSLLGKFRQIIKEAYGAARPSADHLEIDEGHTRVIQSLYPELAAGALVGADLETAFSGLADQAFAALYPAHPDVENGRVEVTVAQLERVLEAVEEATQTPDGIIRIDGGDRPTLRRIGPALNIATMGEDRFRFARETFAWNRAFASGMGAENLDEGSDVSVAQARAWVNGVEPPRGLRKEVVDLIISVWATAEGRTWYRHGAPIPRPRLGQISDDIVMRPVPLPSLETWQEAQRRAAKLFGIATPEFLNGSNAAELAGALEFRSTEGKEPSKRLVDELEAAQTRLKSDGGGRLATARSTQQLLAELGAASNTVDRLAVLSDFELPCSDEAASRSLTYATSVAESLARFDWSRLSVLLEAEGGRDELATSARNALTKLREALDHDEIVTGMSSALSTADSDAFAWLASAATKPPETTAPKLNPEDPTTLSPGRGRHTVHSTTELSAVEAELRAFVDEHGGAVIEWRTDE
ncbi:DUF6079 family protein [Demequina muriae]|uniref:DUF6079 family protein n=1 Tax=Demequina muriae TaxID=3051664 RepID=A0ABT8GE62_9MICO|nr:DUF6079 family protein [Demequina sp. EGI L300058]MDN4479712.1 DUF6079 family protein [Demequina sp. EGI L300058]